MQQQQQYQQYQQYQQSNNDDDCRGGGDTPRGKTERKIYLQLVTVGSTREMAALSCHALYSAKFMFRMEHLFFSPKS